VKFVANRWLRTFRNLVSGPRRPRAARTRPAQRLLAEQLETRLTPSNVITTIAGTGSAGYGGDGGPATAAMMYMPFGTAVDSSGNVFIADTVNHRVREIAKATGNIVTVAGNGSPFYNGDNMPATSAAVGYPHGVAVDGNGNLFIADSYNNRIREVVKATGNIITVAGTGTAGSSGDNGPATSATLNYPWSVAVDGTGNLFIADTQNNRVREVVKATGNIITVAGTGTAGYGGDNGPAAAAPLNQPTGVATDAAGDVFIADSRNYRVREVVQATGNIVTVAGTGGVGSSGDGGPATVATLNTPSAVALDPAGNVFIADSNGERVREVTKSTGVITTVAGTGYVGSFGDAGPATSAPLDYPNGVAVDAAGNLYIADTYNYRIREVFGSNLPYLGALSSTAWTVNQPGYSGTLSVQGGTIPYGSLTTTGLPPGLTASLNGSTVAVSGTPTAAGTFAATFNVLDAGGNRASRTFSITVNATPALGALTPAQGTAGVSYTGAIPISGGTGPLVVSAQANLPPGLSATVSGTRVTFTGIPNTAGTYGNVQVTVRDATGVTASGAFSITIIAPAPGSILTVAGNGTGGYNGDGQPANLALLYGPRSVATDAAGNVYIADSNNNRVREIVKATGTIVTVAGTGAAGFGGDNGSAAAARLNDPTGVAVDPAGNLFIADLWNNRIREVVKATGNIITVAGNGSWTYSGDGGPATSAGLASPQAVAVDVYGDLYIADASSNRVREVIKATGQIVTVAGTGTAGYGGDNGPATAAKLSNPTGVAVDPAGNLYIADTSNQRVREVLNNSGVIISVAGTGTAGYSGDNGPAFAAKLNAPQGLATDANGNLFIADLSNYRIRELVQANGTIVTVAGNGSFGYGGDGGPATSASVKMWNAYGVAVDGSGDLFIADSVNNAVREVLGNPSSPVLGSLVAPTAWTVNQPGYSGTIGVTSGTAPYGGLTATGLPPGLTASLSGSTVTVSGTPTATGTYSSISIGVRDANGNSASRTYSITVNAAPALGTLAPTQWTVGRAGYPGAIPLSGGTGALMVSAQSNLPPGLSAAVSGSNVVFTGTPTTAGTYGNVQLTVRDATGATSTSTFVITVNPAPTLGALSSTAWTVNQSGFSGTIGIAGGTGPFSNLTATGLPAGLSASLSGSTVSVSGTPTATGTFNTINVSVRDTAGATSTGTFTITVNAVPTLGALSSSAWTMNQPGFSGTTTVSAGTGPFGGLTASNLPTGLTASLSGSTVTLSGTPTTAPGTYGNISITVVDAAGAPASRTFSITINAAPALGTLAPTQWTAGQSGYPGAIPLSGGTGTLTVSAQSNLPPGLSATVSGANVTFTGTPTSAGTFGNASITVQDATGATGAATFSITINPAPTLGALSSSAWTVSQPGFNGTVAVSGGTGSYGSLAASNLPPGLTASLSGSTITVSGTPTTAGTYGNATLSVKDAAGATATGTFTFTVNTTPTLGTLTPVQWTAGVAGYPGAIPVSGGTAPFTVTAQSNLPPGLSATTTGTSVTFAGTPTAAGTFANLGLTVQDATGVAVSAPFTVTINHPGPFIAALAGTGTAGYGGDNGPATAAQLSGPTAMAADGSGNLFIADAANNVIREVVKASGTIVTVAGTGTAGYGGDNGPATAAQLANPKAVTVDVNGNLFIADAANNVIREVVHGTGTIVTVAGTGTAGYGGDGGPPNAAQLNGPTGVAVDGSGNLFIADAGNNAIRELVPATGTIVTVAGTGTAGYGGDGGPATAAQLASPAGVAVDGSGNLFIADTGNNVLREVAHATGTIATVAGTGAAGYGGDNGPATAALLNRPGSLAVDGHGDLFVADTANNRVREVVPATGAIVPVAGTGAAGSSGDNGPATAALLSAPTGVAVDAYGDLFVADTANNRVREVRAVSSPSLGALSPTAWTVNQAGFNGIIPVSGGLAPFGNLTVTGLPAGLTAALSGSTITVSGTPTSTGTFGNINATVNDATGAIANAGFSITVNPAPTLGALSSTAWTANQPGFSGTVTVSGGTNPLGSLTASNLPPGLTAARSGSTITVSGTPTTAGTYGNVGISVTDAAGVTASGTYSITINAAPALGTLAPAQWTVGRPGYPGTIPVSGGTGTLTLTAQSNLPPGLSAALSGTSVTINGTPATVGTYGNVQLTVRDATGATSSGTFAITIDATPALGTLPATAWTVNQPGYSSTINVTGGTGPFGNLTATGLPAGLTASLSGSTVTVSGTPTATGTFANVTIGVVDAAGASASRTYTLTINAALALGTLTPTQWTVNQSGYSGTIPVSGGTGPMTLGSQANLPPGLSAAVGGTSISITGTPTTVGTYNNVQLTVQDAAGATVRGTFTITITLTAPLITTLAGNGTKGYGGDGGPGTAAMVSDVFGVAVDGSGNVFFADDENDRVREIVKATGNVITVAGNGTAGFAGDGGPATAAELNSPYGLALDASGNLFIGDFYNNRVREVVKATGNIITVAGNGIGAYAGDGGPATAAELFDPDGLAVDAAGNLFIADYANERVREVVKATGNIITVAGNGIYGYSGDGGPATAGQLYGPTDVVVDANGNVLIADAWNSRIREVVKATGNIVTIAGTGAEAFGGDGGPATAAQLGFPESLALDAAGNLIISDNINNRIREVSQATGVITTIAGVGTYGYSGDGGPATAAQLNAPKGVALDPSGNIYFSDQNNYRIREILSGSMGPQLAIPSKLKPSAFSGTARTLTNADLQPIVAEAIRRWTAAGLNSAQQARLRAVQFQVTDLSDTVPNEVGVAELGVVRLDARAAGFGWFVDPTPANDSEFATSKPPAGMDLLTVVMHELGHELGLFDLNTAAHPGDLMAEGLAPGVRRAQVSAYDKALLGIPTHDQFLAQSKA
jgi:sugar lactone lactonase YvrE